MSRPARVRARMVWILAGGLAALPGAAPAQDAGLVTGLVAGPVGGPVARSVAGPVADTVAYRAVAIHRRPHQTSVAVAIRLGVGSQDDPAGQEGAAWLLARALESRAAGVLADQGSGATVTATVGRTTTLVTVLAFPDDWTRALRAVEDVFFSGPLDEGDVERERAALLARLAFEAGSPVRDFADEAAGLLADPGSPYARPVRGTAASVAALSADGLSRFRAEHYRDGVQAVVGALPPEQADAAPSPSERADAAPPPPMDADTASRAVPEAGAQGGPAWRTGDRRAQVQDVTSTWMEVAYPAPPSLPRTQLELVAHLLKEELDPTPPDPDRYSVDVRIEEPPGGPVLVVEAAVFPEATARWEGRITAAVQRLAGAPIAADFFSWRRRRFRTARLLEEGAPEAEAARMTADLLRDGRVRDLGLEIWGLDAAALSAAARALGEPRIFIFGPDLGGVHE